MTQLRDRLGNSIDPTVGYARGPVLGGTDEEVAKTLRARRLVRECVATRGPDGVFDLSGMNRGGGLTEEDLRHLGSHVPFFAAFEGETEPYALSHMGADPARHDALILNRVSAANFVMLTTVLHAGDRVLALAPSGGTTHPSIRRPVAMAGAVLEEVYDAEALERATPDGPAPRVLVVTPISASKHHVDPDHFRRALALPRRERTLAFVDDAHLASRVGFWGEPRTFEMGPVDLAVCSADKHVAGPRAGILVGRRDLVKAIRSRAWELGLEAQASQYVGVRNALRDFDPKRLAGVGEIARELLRLVADRYGEGRAYLGGPGVSLGGEEAIAIARDIRGGVVMPRLVPVEASAVVALAMLEADGILTIAAVAMPGSAPVVRLMMYPDGGRLGAGRIAASLDRGLRRLAGMLDDVEAARHLLLGEP